MEDSIFTYAIGLLAQLFFSARILTQWILSEKARKSLSPTIFWVFSIVGSWLLCIYGWLRNDFSIVLGQLMAYYIYLWNLNMKGVWKKVPLIFRLVLVFTPVAAVCFVLSDAQGFVREFFMDEDVPLWLVLYGTLGQILFVCRFIYQWLYSRRKGESQLPAGFWIISLVGSACIVSYGIIRKDPILILGQSFGLVSYIRNLCIIYKRR